MFLKLYFMTDKIQIVKIFIEKKLKDNKSWVRICYGTNGTQGQCEPGLFWANQKNIYNQTREPERERDEEINRYWFPMHMSTLLRTEDHISNGETLAAKSKRHQLWENKW